MVRSAARRPMTRWNSTHRGGHPWSSTSGVAPGSPDRAGPSRAVLHHPPEPHLGYWFERTLRSARQSNRSCRALKLSGMVSTSVPNVQPSPGNSRHRVARRRAAQVVDTASSTVDAGIHRSDSSSTRYPRTSTGPSNVHRGRGCCARPRACERRFSIGRDARRRDT